MKMHRISYAIALFSGVEAALAFNGYWNGWPQPPLFDVGGWALCSVVAVLLARRDREAT